MKIILELQDQPSNIRRITVRHDIVIGRGADCNLRLSAPQVSRRHCFVRVSRDGASVTDLDSSNGTFLDGKRIQSGKRYELANDAVLSLGPIRFRVSILPETLAPGVVANAVSDSVDTEAPIASRSSSTVVQPGEQVVNAADSGSRMSDSSSDALANAARHGRVASVEGNPLQASVGSTADLEGDSEVDHGSARATVDSKAEIVGLGKQLADLGAMQQTDGQAADGDADDPLDVETGSNVGEETPRQSIPAALPETSDEVLDFDDIVEVIEDDDLTDLNSGGSRGDCFSNDEIVEIDESAEVIDADEEFGAIEIAEVDESDDEQPPGTWFDLAQQEDSGDDQSRNPSDDDNLNQFLRGL